MTTHDDLFAGTAAEVNLAQHGERIIYRPKGGRPRPITALITRTNLSAIAEAPHTLTQHMTVRALNHPIRGIVAPEQDSGGDEVDVAVKKGGQAETRSITRFVGVIGGMTVVEVQ